jgi:hypothetical protein
MVLVNTVQEPKVKPEEEQFLMIAVFLWLFKFRTAKILNILTEVAFYLEVEKILKLVLTKTTICMPLQVLLLKNNLIPTLGLI